MQPVGRVTGIMLTLQSQKSNGSVEALGQHADSVKLATQSQQRLKTRTHQLTQAEAKQALHVMRLMKTSIVNHDCLLLCVCVVLMGDPNVAAALQVQSRPQETLFC